MRAGLLRGVVVAGLLALAGCQASSGAARSPTAAHAGDASRKVEALLGSTSGDAAAGQACKNASSCRVALEGLQSEVPVSPCELRQGVGIATHACELGVAEGCTELGRMKLWGIETDGESDVASARVLFQRACAGGDGEGCARHALLTLLDEGASRDRAGGMAELQAACEKYPRAACGISATGLMEVAQRRGVEPEQELIALFAQRGCDAADARSCEILGDAFHKGAGVSRDLSKAFLLYQRACEGGNGVACANEGMMALQSSDETEAPRVGELFSRGCALGSSEACRSLVLMTAQRGEVVKDDAAQQALFRQGCDRGAAVGCLALYDVLRRKPSQAGEPLALPGLLKRACRFGEANACDFLDEVSSVAQRQCEGGVAASCGVLGALLLSQPAQEHEAVDGLQLIRHACQRGDEKSCKLMRDVQPRTNELTCRSK